MRPGKRLVFLQAVAVALVNSACGTQEPPPQEPPATQAAPEEQPDARGDEPPIRVKNRGSVTLEPDTGSWVEDAGDADDAGPAWTPDTGEGKGSLWVRVIPAGDHRCAKGNVAGPVKVVEITYGETAGAGRTIRVIAAGSKTLVRPKDEAALNGSTLTFAEGQSDVFVKAVEAKGLGTPWDCTFNDADGLNEIVLCSSDPGDCSEEG